MKNFKQYAKLGIITFIVVFITDFIIHGMIMKSAYEATANLWRPELNMGTYFPFMLAGQFLIALFFAIIFTHGYKGKGIKEGVNYGLLMGGLMAGQNFVMHAVHPYPLSITVSWIVFGFVQAVICGVVLSKLVK